MGSIRYLPNQARAANSQYGCDGHDGHDGTMSHSAPSAPSVCQSASLPGSRLSPSAKSEASDKAQDRKRQAIKGSGQTEGVVVAGQPGRFGPRGIWPPYRRAFMRRISAVCRRHWHISPGFVNASTREVCCWLIANLVVFFVLCFNIFFYRRPPRCSAMTCKRDWFRMDPRPALLTRLDAPLDQQRVRSVEANFDVLD